MSFTYVIWMKAGAAVELYIDTGEREQNKKIFDSLREKKALIEESFGAPLSWERLDQRRASRIRFELSKGGLINEPEWPTIQNAMIDSMDRLAKAMKPHLARG